MPNKPAIDAFITGHPGLQGTPGATTCTITGTVSTSALDDAIQAVKAAGAQLSVVGGVLTITYHGV